METRFQSAQNTGVVQRRASASQSSSPSFTEIFGEFNRLNQVLMNRVNQVVLDSLQPTISRLQSQPATTTKARSTSDCGDPCQHDDCHCKCCVGDADLVIYARLGERRVVPIIITNDRRRERQIKLDLSDWTTHGGRKTGVKAALNEKEFTLAACSEKEVVLLIEILQAEPAPTPVPAPNPTPAPVPGQTDAVGLNTSAAAAAANRILDVDDCTVLYADLRVEGCDVRPVRLALALLPRDCAPFEIHCSCNCCSD